MVCPQREYGFCALGSGYQLSCSTTILFMSRLFAKSPLWMLPDLLSVPSPEDFSHFLLSVPHSLIPYLSGLSLSSYKAMSL